MRNCSKYLGILILAATLMLSSCKDDTYVVPTVVITTPVSFATAIQPIFNANCAISGCHVPGSQAPDLSAGNSYTNLYQYALIDTSAAATSILYLHVTANGYSLMPPVGALSPTQVGTILAWIKQGGLNN